MFSGNGASFGVVLAAAEAAAEAVREYAAAYQTT